MKFADLLVGEEVDLFEFVVAVVVQVHLAGFSLFRELVEREQVDASSEAVFDVDFVEEGNHVFCLVIGVVEVFDAVEDYDEDDFVIHDACCFQEHFVAFMDPFGRGSQHVFRFAVHAYDDS